MKKIVTARMPFHEKNAFVTVLYEDGQPQECFVRSSESRADEGCVYTGLVEKVDKALNAAFVRIGNGVTGYLPLKNAEDIIFCGGKKGTELKPQDMVLVMIKKAAVKTKHCVLTGELSISGKYLVIYSKKNGRAGFSRKLSKEQCGRIKDMENSIPHEFDITFRTLCVSADQETVRAEYERLCEIMERMTAYGVMRPYGTCLYKSPSYEEQMMKTTKDAELEEIVTDDPGIYDHIRNEACAFSGISPEKARLYSDPMIDLYKLYNFSTLLDRITGRKAHLRSGANIIIEETEAFTVIDVNSANSSKKYKNSASFLPVNLEAAKEIALQMRLRQISGVILIDFISMDSKEEEEELIRFFKELVKDDPVRTSVVDITRLGIMEVTREKRYKNIREQLDGLF